MDMNRHRNLMYVNKDKQIELMVGQQSLSKRVRPSQFLPAICDCGCPYAVKANCGRDAQETDVWGEGKVALNMIKRI